MRNISALALLLPLMSVPVGALDTLVVALPQDRIMPPPLAQPKVEFAVINAPDADYLQSEFSSLPTGTGVRVDSISVHTLSTGTGEVRANLEVHWRWAQAGRDSLVPTSRRVQSLDRIPAATTPGVIVLRSTLQVDTIWACQDGRCVIAPTPKQVRNYSPFRMICMADCMAFDSAATAEGIRAEIARGGVAVAVHPLQESIRPIRSAWRTVAGSEEILTLSASLPGNAGNWIAEDIFRFSVSPIAYTSAAKPNIPRSLDYRTGPAAYMYDRTANPSLKILEDLDLRVVSDTLVKLGKTLLLQGSTKSSCGAWINDSLVGRDSWFVVPDSTGKAQSIEDAMHPSLCQARRAAWRLSGDTVWLGEGRWPVRVNDLLPFSGTSKPRMDAVSKMARLVGTSLELPWGATVSLRDLSGRRLGAVEGFESGIHGLNLGGHRGAFLVEIRNRENSVLQTLKGTTLAH